MNGQEKETMDLNEIIEMARQAGFETMLCKGKILGFDRDGDYTEELEAFAKLVAAKEREACIVDIQMHIPRSGRDTLEYKMAMRMIERIRARA